MEAFEGRAGAKFQGAASESAEPQRSSPSAAAPARIRSSSLSGGSAPGGGQVPAGGQARGAAQALCDSLEVGSSAGPVALEGRWSPAAGGATGAEGCAPRRNAGEPLGPVDDPDRAAVVAICKALGEASRFSILQLIARAGELCSCEIEQHFQLSQPTISHHLKLLRRAGLIQGERRGTWIYYRVDPAGLTRLASHPLLVGSAELDATQRAALR